MHNKYPSDSPLFLFVSTVSDLIWLNLLTLICSIPIITIGASATALNYAVEKLRNREGGLLKAYFHSFKENFKQTTVIWLVMLVIGALLVFALLFYDATDTMLPLIVICLVLAVWGVIGSWLFPLCAKFYFVTRDAFRNAVMCAIGCWPISLMMLVANFLPFVLFYFFPEIFVQFSFVWILIWFALATYFIQYLLKRPFELLISAKKLED